ncbi:MAG: hypothetical protein EA374_02100 [Acholeplasmatales bacterium]|nr:MAG: hypothetical protein EA374_02100 [Acholeplasmatales bacterium]
MNTKFKLPYIFSWIVLAGMVLISVGGLLLPEVYQDNEHIRNVWRVNDWVTLVLAAPILAVALVVYKKTASIKALLIWFSLIWYTVYNYMYYLFGAHFNAFFLGYVTLFTLALIVLMLGLPHLPIQQIKSSLHPKLPLTPINIYMLFIALSLSVAYIAQSVAFIFTGEHPPIVPISGHVTSVVFAIDFPFVVAFFIMAAILLWKKNPWGYVMAVMLNLKGAIYMVTLSVASFQAGSDEAPLWVFIGVFSTVLTVMLLKLGAAGTDYEAA